MTKNVGTKRPITIISGFLGKGKTTLLRKALSGPNGEHVAVIVNEVGEIALDHHLLREAGEQVVLMGAGCACCNRREALVLILRDLLNIFQRLNNPTPMLKDAWLLQFGGSALEYEYSTAAEHASICAEGLFSWGTHACRFR